MAMAFRGLNVLGAPIQDCSHDPITGFMRTGCCETGPEDRGSHTVCAIMSAEFLAFSKSRGNDLSTPMPMYAFPGLLPGDQWCLCAARWLEAYGAGCAPHVVLASTHEKALDVIPLPALKEYAVTA
jgi:uncharacterized protein